MAPLLSGRKNIYLLGLSLGLARDFITKTIDQINGQIDSYYNKFITEEIEMVDPEENDRIRL